MKRFSILVAVTAAMLTMAACTPPMTAADKARMDQAIAAAATTQADAERVKADADRAEAAADRAEAAAQRAEDAALKCERSFETSVMK
ncbi:MAG: hypothetical protein C0624_12640 [Desulfuromonas sp.]|nr:MAG: hypothetical protein C0624_12640 [Desulfuromonas sp.]